MSPKQLKNLLDFGSWHIAYLFRPEWDSETDIELSDFRTKGLWAKQQPMGPVCQGS
jgi:hypothetical protein